MRTIVLTRSLILLLFFVTMVQAGQAKTAINYSRPTIYNFSGMGNHIYTPDEPFSTTPSGHILHLDLDNFPMFGFESYTVTIKEVNSDETSSFVEFRFIDLMYQADIKSLNLFGGIGAGEVQYNCKVSACENYTFKADTATQVFVQLGFKIATSIDIHLSAHRVMGSNEVKSGKDRARIELGGYLATWGILISW